MSKKYMSYFYNKPKENSAIEPSLFPLVFDKNEFISSSYSNKRLSNQIRLIHEKSAKANDTVKESTLMSVYMAYANVTSGFVSYASQAMLAKIAKVHKDTVTRAIRWLRKGGLISTYHRYKTNGKTKHRTTSKTVLVFFVKFCCWKRNKMIQQGNLKNFINCKVNKETGEIQSKYPNSVETNAVIYNLCRTAENYSDSSPNLSFLS